MKLEAALERFLVQIAADGRSEHTRLQYQRHIRLLARWLAGEGRSREIESIDHEVLALFLASPMARNRQGDGQKKKATAMNTLRSSLRSFFSHAHRAGYVPLNPARIIRRAVCGPPPPRILSPEEQERFITTLSRATGREAERDYMLFDLMLNTGIRLGSALPLEVPDVDLDRNEITLRSVKGGVTGRVFLNQMICNHLREYIRGCNTVTLFTGKCGAPPSTRHVQRRFRMWIKRAGITRPASPHSLRHSFAQGVYRRTRDILLVREALLHKSMSSTLIYARVDEERLRAALA